MRITDRFDMDASILPGQGVAGLCIGEQIRPILQELNGIFIEVEIVNPFIETHMRRFNSAMVTLWEENGVLTQIIVHSGYRGQYAGIISLGSTLADVERLVGPWFKNEVDEFEIQGVEGMCFDIGSDPVGSDDPVYLRAPIKHFCVFSVN
jgi:hypothetical protein